MTDMVKLSIDGIEVEVAKGTTILDAAKQAGILITHYCYHPALPSPANCRMCLVDIAKTPKPSPSCVTTVAEGMVVSTQSKAVKDAHKAVLEFLLINHPLDCPICDKSGECELQDYTYQEGRAQGRYTPDYAKRFNPVEDFGPDILYIQNRCILCTRCVRFMDDVHKAPVLNISERGDRAYVGIDVSEKLDQAWAGNVVDLCPVGALLSKDFLHKARAWDLDKTASICPGCTQGCNMMIETRDNQVIRLRPRPNEKVNRYFMCDEGRLGYQWLNRSDRIEAPLVRRDGKLVPVDWEVALERAAQILRDAGGPWVGLVSPGASNEALDAAMQVLKLKAGTGAFRVREGAEAPLAGVPDLALRPERAANVYGALDAGFTRDWDGAVRAGRGAGMLLVLDELLEGAEFLAPSIYVGTALTEALHRTANVVLPCANMAEEDGSFRNLRGVVQQYWQAKTAPGMARPAAWILGELLAAAKQPAGAKV